MYTQPCFLFLLPIPSTQVICALKRQQNIVVKNINSEINPSSPFTTYVLKASYLTFKALISSP